jgi:plastocyanin
MDLRKILALMMAVVFMGAAGCGGGDDDDEAGDEGGAPAVTAKLGTGSVSGKVSLSGKAPAAAKISMDADPVCKSQHSGSTTSEALLADAKGNLKNVFVYVKEGAGKYPAPTTPALLDQKGCMYTPHVFGIQVGQTLSIQNSDATLHNVHSMATVNDGFNIGQPNAGMKSEKKFTKPEVLVKFKCDVHSWMNCYVGVVTNPFFGVTGGDGGFKISQLPAGSYTLVAVHEKLGESQPQKVDIKDGESKSVNFTFTAQ